MPDIPAAMRAELDRELAGAVEGLLFEAAEHDGKDLIEANVDLMNHMLATLGPRQLATAAAALALRLHRSSVGGRRA